MVRRSDMGTTTDKLNKILESKAAIKAAITNKGVEVSDTDTFASYADKINNIQTGGGSDLGFSDLGYDYTPEYIQEGLEEGKKAYDNFDSQANYWTLAFPDVDITKLRYFPKVTVPSDSPLYNNKFIDENFYNLEIIPDFVFGEEAIIDTRLQGMSLLRSIHLSGKLIIQCTNCFDEDINLEEISGTIDISYPNALNNLFDNCCKLRDISKLNFVGIPTGNASNCFYNVGSSNGTKVTTYNFDTIPQIDLSEVTSINYYAFNSGIKVLPYLNCKNATNVSVNCGNSYKLTGLDMDSAIGSNNIASGNSAIRYIMLYNMGKAEGLTEVELNSMNIGKEDESIPESAGARQALIDSLITNSFDRATASYSACTINLNKETKALLTEDEIAQITAKGFTIA